MDRHGGCIRNVVISPDFFKQLLTRKYDIGIFRQKAEQTELPVGKFPLLSSLPDSPGFWFYNHVPYDDLLLCLSIRFLRHTLQPGVPFQMGPHPGHQLGRVKRLRNIVVRPKPQSPDHIGALRPGCNHENRNINLIPHPPTDIVPAAPGQHHIQQHQIIVSLQQLRNNLQAIPHQSSLIPAAFQVVPFQLRDLLIILHHQYSLHSLSAFLPSHPPSRADFPPPSDGKRSAAPYVSWKTAFPISTGNRISTTRRFPENGPTSAT